MGQMLTMMAAADSPKTVVTPRSFRDSYVFRIANSRRASINSQATHFTMKKNPAYLQFFGEPVITQKEVLNKVTIEDFNQALTEMWAVNIEEVNATSDTGANILPIDKYS